MSGGTSLARADALILFGVSGDLARRKLLPANYHMSACANLVIIPDARHTLRAVEDAALQLSSEPPGHVR